MHKYAKRTISKRSFPENAFFFFFISVQHTCHAADRLFGYLHTTVQMFTGWLIDLLPRLTRNSLNDQKIAPAFMFKFVISSQNVMYFSVPFCRSQALSYITYINQGHSYHCERYVCA